MQTTQLITRITYGFAATCAITIAGCSSEQGYRTGQAWQQNQCNQIADQAERSRCLSRASTSYDDYKRQTEKK